MDVKLVPDTDTESDEYETADEYSDSNESFYSFDDVLDIGDGVCNDYYPGTHVNRDINHEINAKKTEFTGQISIPSVLEHNKEVTESAYENNNSVDKERNDFDIKKADFTEQETVVPEVTEQDIKEGNVESLNKDFKTLDEFTTDKDNNITWLDKQETTNTGQTESGNGIEVEKTEDSTAETIVRECFKELNAHGSELTKSENEKHVINYDNAKTVVEDEIQVEGLEKIKADSRKDRGHVIEIELSEQLSALEQNDTDIKELSFKEKLAYFEKIGIETPKTISNKANETDKVANNLKGESDKNMGAHEDDSSDENDSLVANETSYEDLLDSLLESSQVENDNKKQSSEVEECENSDTEITDLQLNSPAGLDNLVDLKNKESIKVNNLLQESKQRVTKFSEKYVEETNESITTSNKGDPTVLGVAHLNDLPHQSNLFQAKVVYDKESETQMKCTANERISVANDSNQNKTYLLPGKAGGPDKNGDKFSDHMINRQSSVIKENRLTRMPFTDCPDSEILNDIGNSPENSKLLGKSTEDSDNVIVRSVELGTASLLEGSHYKNLRHAKLVNPFISLRKTGLLEQMTSGDTPSKSGTVLNVKTRSKPVGDVLGVSKQETNIVPEVCISVAACESNSLETVKSPGDEHESATKLTKSMRRKIGRHNAIVSDYVANIERAESLRNSLNVEDLARTVSIEEDNQKFDSFAEGKDVIRDRSGSFVKNKKPNVVVRTVEIGTACLYEIPHLKYLHCAKIVSPSS